MMQLSSKNNYSSLCYDASLLINILKIDKFGAFSCDIDYNIGQTYLEMLSPL